MTIQKYTITITALILLFWSAFIWRTSLEIDGERYFTLVDDAMISMTYARNFARGDGLVWNAGEKAVEGYTNLFWVLIMSIPHLLGAENSKASLYIHLLGIAILLGAAELGRRITGEVMDGRSRSEREMAMAGSFLLIASYYPLLYWTLRGMEVGLIALLLLAATYLLLLLRHSFRLNYLLGLAAVVVVALLTRSDAILIALTLTIALPLIRPQRPYLILATLLGSAFATFYLHGQFRLFYYGEPLPNTYYLKVFGSSLIERLQRGVVNFHLTLLIHLWLPAILVLGRAIYLLVRRDYRPLELTLLLLFLAHVAYNGYVGGDFTDHNLFANRFITTAMPPLLILLSVALVGLVMRLQSGYTAMRATLFATTLFAAYLIGFTAINISLYLTGFWTIAEGVDLQSLPGLYLPIGMILASISIAAGGWWLSRIRLQPQERETQPELRLRGGTALLLVLLSIFLLNGREYRDWVKSGGPTVAENKGKLHQAVQIKKSTPEHYRIGVTWAGIQVYFSERRGVDLLGKSDPTIAHMPTRALPYFNPGHDKFDLQWSLCELKPELLLSYPTWMDEDRKKGLQETIIECGYEPDPDGLAAFRRVGLSFAE